ncbi:MAG: tetratricopeptide repeat protein [Candidatus Saganbacteria bacterium]|nr:tetratricopeptide repeat protein [Candidatus Saganbacteria bacterium]
MKKLALALILIFIVAAPVLAWKITPELQNELNQRLADVQASPYSPDAHFELAITYAYTNKIQEGMDELKKVHSLDPDYAPIALDIYSKAAKANPDSWKALYRYAFALYFNNKKNEAVDTFKQVIKIDPKNVFAYGYIALILGEQNKINEGVDWTKKGLAVDNEVAAMHLLLAAGYNRQGKNWESFWEGVEALRLKSAGF